MQKQYNNKTNNLKYFFKFCQHKDSIADREIESRLADIRKMQSKNDPYRMDINENMSPEMDEHIKMMCEISCKEYKGKIRREKLAQNCFFKYISKCLMQSIKSFLTRRK